MARRKKTERTSAADIRVAPWAGGPVPTWRKPPPWETLARKPRRPLPDIGPLVLENLYSALMVDDKWAIREDRAFTWWPWKLAQRVSVSAPRLSFGDPTVCVRATSDMVTGVDAPEALVLQALSVLNMHSSLCAYVWDPDHRRISVTTSAYLYADVAPHDGIELATLGGNLSLMPTVSLAVLLATIEAHSKAEAVASLVGGRPDETAHPSSGPRPEPDELLDFAQSRVVPKGAGRSAFTPFLGEARMRPAEERWCMSTLAADSFTGELPFFGTTPTTLQVSFGTLVGLSTGHATGGDERFAGVNLETTLVQYFTNQPHPGYGSGLLMIARLPVAYEPAETARLVADLNRAEATELTGFPLLGGWCTDPTNPATPVFVTFVPSILARPGLVHTLSFYLFLRNGWARARLT